MLTRLHQTISADFLGAIHFSCHKFLVLPHCKYIFLDFDPMTGGTLKNTEFIVRCMRLVIDAFVTQGMTPTLTFSYSAQAHCESGTCPGDTGCEVGTHT